MVSAEINVPNTSSLLAQPAAAIAQAASKYSCTVMLERGETTVNAKSTMGVLSLGITEGDTITLNADGIDDVQALDELSELIRVGFVESELQISEDGNE